jgi:septal ring factor EnvC (AmiA/AmiB activator)
MAEGNGSGRLDRIEAVLETVGKRLDQISLVQERDHEEFTRDHKQLMTWQVLMQDKMEKDREEQKAKNAALDARVDKLVSSIGELISKIPPAALKG